MDHRLKPWQLVLLVLLFPPVGSYFVYSHPDIKPAFKILAFIYFIAVLLTVLLLKLPVGELQISAARLS